MPFFYRCNYLYPAVIPYIQMKDQGKVKIKTQKKGKIKTQKKGNYIQGGPLNPYGDSALQVPAQVCAVQCWPHILRTALRELTQLGLYRLPVTLPEPCSQIWTLYGRSVLLKLLQSQNFNKFSNLSIYLQMDTFCCHQMYGIRKHFMKKNNSICSISTVRKLR